jgi:hypothetical protein
MCQSLPHRVRKSRVRSSNLFKAASIAALASPSWESLEYRRLFNAVTLTDGVLSIQGSATVGSHLTAYLVNSGNSIDASADAGVSMIVPVSSVTSIQITGGSGADYMFVDNRIPVPVTITGGDGNDSARGGGAFNDIIEGNGNDWINGNGTVDSITVGDGNDTILGSAGNDTITAGAGSDSIEGSDGADLISVGSGNDTVNGDGGNDSITAGNGTDSINGGLGSDSLVTGTGLDTVIPGSGTNYVNLGNASSVVVPSAGVNTIVTATGSTGTGGSSGTGTGTTGTGTTGTTGTGTTGTGTGTTTAGSTTWVSYYAASPTSSTAPQAQLQVLAPNLVVGAAVDVNGASSLLGTGSPIDANYSYNFGDPTGEYNILPGYNATHIYTQPGTYTITLTVTNELGQTSTVSTGITISADNRRAIYVDSINGSDSNNGSSPGEAVQTAAYADTLITDNTEVFFDRGETFNINQSFLLHNRNLLIGAYGTGAQPVINYTTTGVGTNIFSANSDLSIAVTIQDLTFTALNGTELSASGLPMAVMAGGTDIAVLRCTFDGVEYAVNASAAPDGLTVEDSSSPVFNGVQGYFLWDQGSDTSIINNYADGSGREHIVRTSSATDILAMDNNFINADGKGCIEIHEGAFAWIVGNTVTGGDIRVGPLGLWGEPVTSATDDAVIEQNTVNNTFIAVDPGAHDISIRNNIISRNTAMMIDVNGTDSQGRVASDIRIYNNTGISAGATGNFLKVESHTAGIDIENNLLVAPNLTVGGYNSGPVYLVEGNMTSISDSSGNVWQLPAVISPAANGGINLVGTLAGEPGSVTPVVWDAYPDVGMDWFVDTTLTSTDAPAIGSVAANAGTPIEGFTDDYYGDNRPTTGAWSAGAVQVE